VSRPGGGQADLSDGIGLIIEERGLRSTSHYMGVRVFLSYALVLSDLD
jgi:hypothetical protein